MKTSSSSTSRSSNSCYNSYSSHSICSRRSNCSRHSSCSIIIVVITRIPSVERIAAEAVTLRLPRASVSDHMAYIMPKSCLIRQQSTSKRPDLRGFRDIKDQIYCGHDLDLSRSRDVISHMTIRLALCGFL